MRLKGNILVVDDEKNIREGLKISLLKDEHKVFLAGDGLEALKIMDDIDIDVIIKILDFIFIIILL